MENKNISQIAFERIQKEGIKPISRRIFSIKRVLFWAVVISSLIVGALTFAVILSALFNNDWYLYDKFGFNFILKTLPYFWFISLLVFIILGDFYYRKTLVGYRHSFVFVISIYLTSTVIFGSVFYLIGVGNIIEESLENNTPLYRNIMLNRNEVWSHPEEGLLSGEIVRIRDNEIEIMDFDGLMWIISLKDCKECFPEGNVSIEIGQRVKVIGNNFNNNFFKADEVRPWYSMGMTNR